MSQIPGTLWPSSNTIVLMACTVIFGVAFLFLICKWMRWLDEREDRRIERKRRMRVETP